MERAFPRNRRDVARHYSESEHDSFRKVDILGAVPDGGSFQIPKECVRVKGQSGADLSE